MKLSTLKPKIAAIDTRRAGNPSTERIRGGAAMKIRDRILKRDAYRCQSCGHLFSPSQLVVDHVVPLHLGGTESDDNRQALCLGCHDIKTIAEQQARDGGGGV